MSDRGGELSKIGQIDVPTGGDQAAQLGGQLIRGTKGEIARTGQGDSPVESSLIVSAGAGSEEPPPGGFKGKTVTTSDGPRDNRMPDRSVVEKLIEKDTIKTVTPPILDNRVSEVEGSIKGKTKPARSR